MPSKRRDRAIATLDALGGWGEKSTAVDSDWLEEPYPLHEFCERFMDITPWPLQREDLEKFLGSTSGETKRLFTQDPPTDFNCGILCYGKGSGKDSLASLSLVWFAHVLLCMNDPQAFLGLAPQEPIDIALASPTLRQTRRVTFQKLKNRLKTCTWMRSHLERRGLDAAKTLRRATDAADFIELPNAIRIHNLPLQSTSAEGFNLLAFVISEFAGLESEAQGATAEALFNTFVTSCRTRYRKAWKGFLASFPRSVNDPQEKLIEAQAEGRFPELFVVRRATWEVVPHLSYKDFETEFIRDPEGSQAKLAAQPRAATEAYFRSPDLIVKHASGGPMTLLERHLDLPAAELLKRSDRVLDPVMRRDIFGDVELNEYGFPQLFDWFKGRPDVPYLAHCDLAISGDSAGFCLGHMAAVEDRFLPVLDLQFRWKASHFADRGPLKRINWNDGEDTAVEVLQSEIDLRTITEFLIWLVRRRNFQIEQVSFDQFNSAESRQVLHQYGIAATNFSVDREQWVWPELKGLIYGRNLQYRIGPIEFAELRKLVIRNGRVDAPRTTEGDGGSHKDIADCMAAIAGQLAGQVANETDYYQLPEETAVEPEAEDAAASDLNQAQSELWQDFLSEGF